MGRLAIILVLSLSFTAGIIAYSINISKTRTVENVSGFEKYTTARNIAHTGVNMMLRTLDKNDTSYVNPLQAGQKVWLVKNFMAGLCSVSIKLKNPAFLDTVDMTTKAVFLDTIKTMSLRLRRQPIPFPVISEAVGLRVNNPDFKMTGTPNIDGRNHDINGTLLAASANDKPGVGVMASNPDSVTVAGYGSKIDGTQDAKVDTGMSDPALFVNDYTNAADYVFTAGTYGGNRTWGSQAAPVNTNTQSAAGPIRQYAPLNPSRIRGEYDPLWFPLHQASVQPETRATGRGQAGGECTLQIPLTPVKKLHRHAGDNQVTQSANGKPVKRRLQL